MLAISVGITKEKSHVEMAALAVPRETPVPDPDVSEDTHITDWKPKPDFCSWVLSDPQLKNVDLRPYFFACKGAEDYFFEQTQNETIRQLISKLMGSSMAAERVVQ